MAARRQMIREGDHLDWWRDKLRRMDDRTFALPKWGRHILDALSVCDGHRVEARDLKQLAVGLGVPIKYVPRAVASVIRLGIATACLQPPALSIELHRNRLSRRKIGLKRPRKALHKSVREALKVQSNFRCACCRESCTSRELALDHIIPLSLLGADHPANLVPMKKSHNVRKWDRFGRTGLKFYRGEPVRQRLGVRFIAGSFWPVINGRLRRSWPVA